MNTIGEISPAPGEVVSLDQAYFVRPWSAEAWEKIDFNHHILLTFNNQSRLSGFALLGWSRGDDTAHLYKILLIPELQGSGLALKFWDLTCDFLRASGVSSVYLEVESHNQRALGFYQKAGFQCLRKVKSYYSDGSDGVMMQLTL